ncbi:MAG: YHYH protein [Bacteroidetes bacterium]|nr:YHYH protein [Bacteroidota bacterium]MBS1669907.1 YHYH protein [Bacteroidota bacterium]
MKKTPLLIIVTTIAVAAISFSCSKDTSTTNSSSSSSSSTSLPTVYKKIISTIQGTNLQVYVDGNYVVIKSNGLPDHKSPYYKGTQWASTMYEAYNGTGTFNQNPNTIASQNYVFKIPITPSVASSSQQTPMGPMGIAINGVPIFNQYAAGRVALTSEIISFDQYGGHPAQAGDYHYHVEPLYITTSKGKDALLGFLLDGYPVYGPLENGKTLTSSDLDAYHGHTGVTEDYPNGTYHYHITADAPYINGTGFYGNPGTVTN